MAPDRLEDLCARGSCAALVLLGIGGRRRRFERTVSLRLPARLRGSFCATSHREWFCSSFCCRSRELRVSHEMLGIKGPILLTCYCWTFGSCCFRDCSTAASVVSFAAPAGLAVYRAHPDRRALVRAMSATYRPPSSCTTRSNPRAAGYLGDAVVKPLLMVVYALLSGRGGKAAQPEKFLVPMVMSIWVMAF